MPLLACSDPFYTRYRRLSYKKGNVMCRYDFTVA
ncbi:hypothetical protein T11_16074, partial [Trichinella zimbabwensis]